MDVKITIVVENTTPRADISGEYGLAVMVNIDKHKILFDTGSAGALFNNARSLGINLNDIEDVIISHGHYDHTGAMPMLLQEYGVRRVYAHPDIFLHRVIPLSNGKLRNIGCVFSWGQLDDAGVKLILTPDFTEIYPDLFITGQIPRINDYENTGGNFKAEIDGEFIDDKLNDDMALVINHPEGLIIISGCAHAGIINTIEYAIKKTGRQQVQAFIGGTHLMSAAPLRINRTITALKQYHINKIVVCHCTGFYAAAELYSALGSAVVKGDAGMSFRF